MSNLRIFWIIWCSGWAFFWLLTGFFTFLLGWLFVPLSLLAILIPVGVEPHYSLSMPDCVRCGKPAKTHYAGKCPVAPSNETQAPEQQRGTENQGE